MRAREPVAQLRGRLVGCFTVKRHQRDRDSRNPDDLSPPTVIGDECDLNEIGTPRDHGFEALYLHDSSLEFLERKAAVCVLTGKRHSTYGQCKNKRRNVRSRPTNATWRKFRSVLTEKKFICLLVHKECTGRPQLFNRSLLDWSEAAHYCSFQLSVLGSRFCVYPLG